MAMTHDSDDASEDPGSSAGGVCHHLSIDASGEGQRLDLFVGHALGLSRQKVKTLLDQQAILLNGRPVTVARKGLLLRQGSELDVTLPATDGQWPVLANPSLDLKILAQGSGYLMLDKPAGMPVHPLLPTETDTLLNAAIARFPQIQGVGEAGLRSGVVHRLDVETSGVIVLATEQATWQAMRQAFADHRTSKTYAALVHGRIEEHGSMKLDLTIAQHRPAKVKVVDKPAPQSRRCDLTWRVARRYTHASLIHVFLGTGFLHQIRVMMAHLGHPVVGDKVYGHDAADLPPPARLMLHAHHLDLLGHAADSPIPPAMQQYMDALR